MDISYDPNKNAANIAKHGVSLAAADLLDWDKLQAEPDDRFPYSEQRYIGYAPIGARLYCVVFTYRDGGARIISLRKANKREQQRYEQLN